MTKIIVEQDITPIQMATHFFKKCGLATVPCYAGKSNWIIPSFKKTALEVDMDNPLAVITDNGSQLNVESSPFSGRTPSDFDFRLDSTLKWVAESVTVPYKKLTIGKLYSLYLLYYISKTIFDIPKHDDLIELASSISYSYEQGHENTEKLNELVINLVPFIAVIRKVVMGQENNFINFFNRVVPKKLFTACNGEWYDKTKAITIYEHMVQSDILIDYREKPLPPELQADPNNFEVFEKYCIKEITRHFLSSNYFRLQMLY